MTISPKAIMHEHLTHDSTHLQIIMQYLSSRGLYDSLAAIENESQVTFDPDFLSTGSVLDGFVEQYILQGKECVLKTPTLQESRIAVTDILSSFPNVHGSNVNPTCVAFGHDIIVTGGADARIIIRSTMDCTDISIQLPSPALSLDVSGRNEIVVGCMGGEVVFLHNMAANMASDRYTVKPYGGAKRITSAHFNPTGDKCAVASYSDHSVKIFNRDDTGTWNEDGRNMNLLITNNILSVCWVANDVIAVAENSNCIISLVNVQQGKVTGSLCMNKYVDDPRTSTYSTLCMYFDETSKILTACTSRNSVLLFSLDGKSKLDINTPFRTLYGMSIGPYDTPSVSMSLDSKTLYVTNNNEILLIDINTGHKLYDIKVSETRAIRHLRRHPTKELVATVSFDKQLTILE